MCFRSQTRANLDQSGRISQAWKIKQRGLRSFRSWKRDTTSCAILASFHQMRSTVAYLSSIRGPKWWRQSRRGKGQRSKGTCIVLSIKTLSIITLVNIYNFIIFQQMWKRQDKIQLAWVRQSLFVQTQVHFTSVQTVVDLLCQSAYVCVKALDIMLVHIQYSTSAWLCEFPLCY